MNFLLKYFGRRSGQSSDNPSLDNCGTGEVRQCADSGRDDYLEEASYGWLGDSPISSSIFDAPRRSEDAACNSDTRPCKTIAAQPPAGGDIAEPPGFDPYNTGSIEVRVARSGRAV